MKRKKWRSPVGLDGRCDPWISSTTDGQSGVYLIRDARTHEVLYIGESHTQRLYQTLTRHFYFWNGRGAGPSYHPGLVEVAVIVASTPLDSPVEDQYALIQKLKPRDNVMDGRWLFQSLGKAVAS